MKLSFSFFLHQITCSSKELLLFLAKLRKFLKHFSIKKELLRI
jgi:hypothetical protein